jgi:ribosomal 50S subunit-associated protein YjgA (DUF615 family)
VDQRWIVVVSRDQVKRGHQRLDQLGEELVFLRQRGVREVAADEDRVRARIQLVDRGDGAPQSVRRGAAVVDAQVRIAELGEEGQTFLTCS